MQESQKVPDLTENFICPATALLREKSWGFGHWLSFVHICANLAQKLLNMLERCFLIFLMIISL